MSQRRSLITDTFPTSSSKHWQTFPSGNVWLFPVSLPVELPGTWAWSMFVITRLSCCMMPLFLTNSICCFLCDSQPTPRSASTHLELGACPSISLFSTPPLPLLLLTLQSPPLLLTPLAFSLSSHSLFRPLLSILDNLPSASARPLLLFSFRPPPPPLLLLLHPPESLSSMAGQDLLCRTCLFLRRAEFQVHSSIQSWPQPLKAEVCRARIILTVTVCLHTKLLLSTVQTCRLSYTQLMTVANNLNDLLFI